MSQGVLTDSLHEQMDQLFSSILLAQRKIGALRPSDPERRSALKDFLRNYQQTRGRALLYPYCSTGRGHGPFTELLDGSVKYDLISGIGFNILGHSHPIQIKAALEGACLDSMMAGSLQSYEASWRLSRTLLDAVAGSRLRHFWFAGSGSFANDMALKILWQKTAPCYRVIALEKGFSGRTVATHEITDKPAYREGMPKLLEVFHVPGWNPADPEGSRDRSLKALNQLVDQQGDGFCALTLELVQGEGGVIAAPPDYYRAVFDWAKERGLYIWVDEVQTFARTHQLFAFQMFGLDQYVDVVTLGKALQGAGMLYTGELNPKPGLIAGTFNGSLPAIVMANKVVKYLLEGPFYGKEGRMRELEQAFLTGLVKLSQGSCRGKLGNVVAIGTMVAFEVGDASKQETMDYLNALFEHGVIAFWAGESPYRVRLLLPVCLTPEHIAEIFAIIERTTLEVVK